MGRPCFVTITVAPSWTASSAGFGFWRSSPTETEFVMRTVSRVK